MTITNNIPDDTLWYRVCLHEDKVDFSQIEQLLNLLSDSFIPRPTILRTEDGLEYDITGFLDPLVLDNVKQALANDKNTIIVRSEDNTNTTVIDPNGTVYTKLATQCLNSDISDNLVNLTRQIVEMIDPYFIGSALQSINAHIYRKHFQWQDRTWYCPTLVWLQYFGPEEFRIQGGKEIMNNPYIKAEKINTGLLVQVGNSLFDAYTTKGENLLVDATKAMPPVLKPV